jgi:cell division protein ZapA (FtsZ GTPase activity inhibitor)
LRYFYARQSAALPKAPPPNRNRTTAGMEPSTDLININVTICERPYRLKVKPSEEEHVRLAAKMVNDKVKDLQAQYSAKDKQDYLAMATLMFLVEKLGERGDYVIRDNNLQDRMTELESRLDQVLQA